MSARYFVGFYNSDNMKHLQVPWIIFLFFSFSVSVTAQQVSHISITAQVKDTLGETVPAATIMLLNSKDSTLINYTTTNSDGYFTFKNVKNTGCILKISHISFMPLQIDIPVSSVTNVNLGLIKVEPIAEVLMEVVIKSAKAPLFIHGDTVEYDARLFKVPPGSTVEDLLRRLPGIDIDASGNISTQGKDVKRIYVDGKTFFSDDPTTVTKNLDAEAISKVQVYDDKSEQQRLTGIKEGSQDKVMNLELKDEYKKGYFGKATIAGGTDDRWAARGSFNRFNETSQLSFIGYGNNMNETGVNWDDYSEFKGNSAYSDYDNGDFGFSGGGGRFRYMTYSIMGSNYDGRGFTKNAGAGTNYNYFNKKVKFNLGYFYNQSDLQYDQITKKYTFLPDTSYNMDENINFNQFNNAHSINSRVEIEFDSTNTAIFKIDSRISGLSREKIQSQLYQTPGFIDINSNTLNDSTDNSAYSVNMFGLYKHDFKKKGRVFAISGAANVNNNSSEQLADNINNFYMATTTEEQIKLLNESITNGNLYKSSALYVEPLGKRLSLMNFYNFSSNSDKSGKVANNVLDNYVRIDSLCNFYDQTVNYNRIGSSLNYGYEGLNVAIGGAYQIIDQGGIFSLIEGSDNFISVSPKSYKNFIPYFSANYEFPSNLGFDINYSYNVNEPSLTQLQPIITLNNPLYQVEGNTDLVPELSHDISANMHYWSQASFRSISLYANYSINESTIVYNQYTDFVEGLGYVTHSRPENVEGGSSFSSYFWGSMPIIKTILTINLNGQVKYDENPVYINGTKNITNSDYYSARLGINLTAGKKLDFNFSGSVSDNNVKYSIQTNQNQQISNFSTYAGLKWQFAKKSYFESNLSWNVYQNDKLNYDKNIMIVNASIRQIIGAKNRFELRLAAFDLLNQRLYLQQYAAVNYTAYTSSPTLARYFMLSVSYNLKGFETKMKKGRGMF